MKDQVNEWIDVNKELPKNYRRVEVLCRPSLDIWNTKKQFASDTEKCTYIAVGNFYSGSGWYIENPLKRMPVMYPQNTERDNFAEVLKWRDCSELSQIDQSFS